MYDHCSVKSLLNPSSRLVVAHLAFSIIGGARFYNIRGVFDRIIVVIIVVALILVFFVVNTVSF